jgi:hypothetical protein
MTDYTQTTKQITLHNWQIAEVSKILCNISELYRKNKQYDKRGEIESIIKALDI